MRLGVVKLSKLLSTPNNKGRTEADAVCCGINGSASSRKPPTSESRFLRRPPVDAFSQITSANEPCLVVQMVHDQRITYPSVIH